MKKIILSAVVAFTVLTTTNTFAQQGFGTNTPDRSAAVDIVSNKRGLLIPRIELTKTTEAGPVAKPENALFVYNKATVEDVTPGFYYWEAADTPNAKENGAGRWVRFVSSNSGSAVTVSAGTNVTVTPTSNGHDTDYEVSVKGGSEAGQVLVTEIIEINGKTVHTTKWVNPQDFINESVVGENGITAGIGTDGKVHVGLGGDLNAPTEITTDGINTLAITGLEELVGEKATSGTKFDADVHNIVVMGDDGILKVVSAKNLLDDAIKEGTIDGKALTSSSLVIGENGKTALLKDVNIEIAGGTEKDQVLITIEGDVINGEQTYITKWVKPGELGNTVTASNGLTKDANNDIKFGGPLTGETKITTTATNTLALEGLVELEKKDVAGNNLVVADADGVLRETSPKNLIENAIEGGIDAKKLTGNGITVTSGTAVGTTLEVEHALLKDVTLGIADGAVTQEKLYAGKTDATGTKIPATAGTVPVAGADGSVTYEQITGDLVNGKALTSGSISVFGGENALLDATRIDITGGTAEGDVLVTSDQPLVDEKGEVVKDANGNTVYVTKWIPASSLDNTVTASNGLTKDGNDIKLGGDITEATVLNIGTGGSLAITGLGIADKAKTNKVVVVQADGKLATIDKAAGDVTINQEGDVNISDNSVVNNYHPSMDEVVIEVVLKNDDTNLILPAITGTEGQTISIKIANTDETHKGYLNIKTDAITTLVYGAMPYQAWVIKSNGTKWIVVGRN